MGRRKNSGNSPKSITLIRVGVSNLRFSKIKDNDVANGVGITMSLWTQGCPHHCPECFNKETWNYKGGKEFTSDDMQYIIDNIDIHGISRNLSILGGEPLCPENIKGVIDVCKEFKKHFPNKTIYLWTGYVLEDFTAIQSGVLAYIDILIDGRFDVNKKDLLLKMRGSSNQRIIDIQESMKQGQLVEYTKL